MPFFLDFQWGDGYNPPIAERTWNSQHNFVQALLSKAFLLLSLKHVFNALKHVMSFKFIEVFLEKVWKMSTSEPVSPSGEN